MSTLSSGIRMSRTDPLIVVVGETASGKSGLAMEIARRHNGEIIAADSRTIFKGMDIGTAKPTPEDRKTVPHHLLDIVTPDEKFSAAQFKEIALTEMEKMYSRGVLPIMVGGTGLYVDSVLFDYQFGEKANESERQSLENKSMNELHEHAAQLGLSIDHEAATNKRYLVRMIENRGQKNNDRDQMRANSLVIGIKLQRKELRKRIEQRVELMFRNGLRTEVDRLQRTYGWDHEALSGIGYQEFRDYYENDASMSKVKRNVVQNTLKYAKRQRTWFKRNPNIQWFDDPANALSAVDEFLR